MAAEQVDVVVVGTGMLDPSVALDVLMLSMQAGMALLPQRPISSWIQTPI
jgi:hypothetical protein